MTEITFLLNGETVRVAAEPTHTLLDWLREDRGLTGTKEGCNEGDCGACTVVVTDDLGVKALNACILFLPQLHGKAVRTVEGFKGPKGEMHPVQQAMIELRRGRTSFIIAHRLSTIRDADLIVVMDAGRIVEQGTPADLMARRGAYWAMTQA